MGADTGLADMTFGSMAGMVAKIFEHPFDLVKVRLQSQPTDRPLSFTGPFDCFKQTYLKEGIKGLYRGISAPILGAAAENASLFMVYGKFQEAIYYLQPREGGGGRAGLSIGELMIAGAGAGAVTSFVLTPIELIKCRMQVQMLTREGAFGSTVASPSAAAAAAAAAGSSSSAAASSSVTAAASATASSSSSSSRPFSTTSITRQLPPPRSSPLPLAPPMGPLALVADTVRNSGLRGLWLGQLGTLFRETGGSAAWFGAYETSSRFLLRTNHSSNGTATKADLKTWELMASGALAGVSYNVILFPADSVKSSMQTWAELNPGAARVSFGQTARTIWRTRGLKGLYAGCGLTCLRSGPSSAMIFLIFQRLEQNFGYVFGLEQ